MKDLYVINISLVYNKYKVEKIYLFKSYKQ